MQKKNNGKWYGAFAAVFLLGAAGLYLFSPADVAAKDEVLVYKSASCGCCGGWVDHLRQNGFSVKVVNAADMTRIKRSLGVPASMDSCHTGIIDGYLVEGHVPAADIRKLLTDRPAADGIAVPGMPIGSPGMEVPGENPDQYDVVLFGKNGKSSLFVRH